MNRLFTICLVIILSVSNLTACSESELNNTEYAKAYDRAIYKLEIALHNHVFYNLSGFFAEDHFSETYSNTVQMNAMDHLIDVLDDVMYELDILGRRTDDPYILDHQSAVEYALKDIRSFTYQYLEAEVTESVSPNKNTLYRETYRYMTEMSYALLEYIEHDTALDAYLSNSRTPDDMYNAMLDMKTKNRIRYLYTYTMIASYIAPMRDYTGLHVDPRFPWVLVERTTHMAYELSLDVLIEFREFYLTFTPYTEIASEQVISQDMAYFVTELNEVVNAYENYYTIRSTYPIDFFTSGAFKAYQENQGRFWEFKEAHTDLIEMRSNYGIIRDILSDEKMFRMMY